MMPVIRGMDLPPMRVLPSGLMVPGEVDHFTRSLDRWGDEVARQFFPQFQVNPDPETGSVTLNGRTAYMLVYAQEVHSRPIQSIAIANPAWQAIGGQTVPVPVRVGDIIEIIQVADLRVINNSGAGMGQVGLEVAVFSNGNILSQETAGGWWDGTPAGTTNQGTFTQSYVFTSGVNGNVTFDQRGHYFVGVAPGANQFYQASVHTTMSIKVFGTR